jgi:hypothetical protein
MKQIILTGLLLATTSFAFGQFQRINVAIPTPESESRYIWQNIRDIKFFDANGYSLALPQAELTAKLLANSRSNSLNTSDLDSLQALMKKAIYNRANYLSGYNKIIEAMPTIEKALQILSKSGWGWSFREFTQYQINLTLYGPGGSYNPDNGSILLLTTPDGRFKGYSNPANTIIHEMVHIGIDSSIVRRYNLPHPNKEHIVDLFVQTFFGEFLPDYRIQSFGDKRIDKYLTSKEDFANLPKSIEKYLNEVKQH